MQKVREYLKNIFSKKEPEPDFDVECLDFYGNTVVAKSTNTKIIYDGGAMLDHLIGCRKDFKKYLDYNQKKLPPINQDLFVYHETIKELSNHLALLDFYQDILVLDTGENDKRIDKNIYQNILKENDLVEKLSMQALVDVSASLDQLDIDKQNADDQLFKYLEIVEIGFLFQRATLFEDIQNCFGVYKLLDENDPTKVDTKREQVINLTKQHILQKNYLTPEDEEIESIEKTL